MSKALTKTDYHFPGQKKAYITEKYAMCITSTMKN